MKNGPVIIVKKKAPARHGHHGGAWKVAYADFVTAMMAFFLVMWIVGQSQEVKAGVGAYFRDPGVFETTRSGGLLTGSSAAANGATPAPVSDVEAAMAVLEQAAQQLKEALHKMPEFADLQDQIEIELTPEGLRIELLEGDKESFFELGSSALRPESQKLLGVIAAQLGKLPNEIAVEGHTDSRPYVATEAFSNWELSTDRANAARRVMQQSGGLGPNQIEGVRGYAATRLRVENDPLDPRNRRISIVVRGPGTPAS